ncbi:DUF1080 domain-containing protein [Rhodocytophaga aerolata]
MKKLFFICLLVAWMASCMRKPAVSDGWIPLFNGKDLNDWSIKIAGYPLNENYGQTFRVSNGVLQVSYDHYTDFGVKYGHIFYKQPFSAYLLSVEYRFTGEQAKGGPGWALRNSGIMFHAQNPQTMGKDQDFPISIEAQFLGGNGKDERTTLNLCTPGTNVVLKNELYTPHCINSSSRTFHGDQWVKAQLLVLGDSLVKHMVETDTVLVYTKPQIGGGNVINFDPAVKVDGKLLKEGYIALQSESHPVEFRKVELFNLEKYMDNPAELNKLLQRLRTN